MRSPQWLWLVPILLLSAGLTAVFLVHDALWFDELMTYFIAGLGNFKARSLSEIVYVTALDNSWPPAYFFLALAWDRLTGGGLFLNRALPYFIGLLSIAVMYRTGKAMFNARVGVYSALLLGTCSFYLFYFHEVRGYSLYVFASVSQLWAYWVLLKPENFAKRGLRWLFIFATILAIYSHYVAVISVGVLGFYHLIAQRKNENWLDILRLGINGCLTYGLWIAVLFISLYNQRIVDRSDAFDNTLSAAFVAFSNGLVIPMLLVLLASLIFWRNPAVRVLWFWIIGVLVLVAVGNLYARFIFHPRHFIVLLIPIVLLIASLMQGLEKPASFLTFGIGLLWVGAGVFNAATLDFVFNLQGQYPSVPLNTMETAIELGESCVSPNDAVIFDLWHEERENYGINIHNTSYFYYFQEAPFRYAQLQAMVLIDGFLVRDDPENDYVLEVENVVRDAPHIWLMSNPVNPWEEERLRFESIIEERGYAACGAFADNPDFVGLVYSLDASQCESLINSCPAK